MGTGRFTDKAKSGRTPFPQQVSKREGYWILLASALTFFFVTIRLMSLASSSTWLSIGYILSPFLFLLSIFAIAVTIAKTRRVQPYGWRKGYFIATVFSIITVIIGEWFWTWGGVKTDFPMLPFLVGMLAAAPFAGLGFWKIKAGS